MKEYSWLTPAFRAARDALARGSHALLVAGQRGLGKRQLAQALAEAMLCEAPSVDGHACGTCSPCTWIRAGSHPDFWIVEPRSDESGDFDDRPKAEAGARERPISIDQIRAMGERLGLSAHRSGRKAVVICPAEAMNPAAANALLKNLEEPPPGTFFLLVTHRPSFLLPTVRSRCQTVTVRLAESKVAADWLSAQGIADPTLRLAFAGGAPIDAARLGDEATWRRREGFLRAISTPEADPIITAEAYRDLAAATALAWLQKWTFDLLYFRGCARVRYNPDFSAQISALAGRVNVLALERLHRLLLKWQRTANHPLNPRLVLEQLLIRYSIALQN